MIAIYILMLCVGFLMLVKGADWFVEGASGLASKFGVPQLVIGLTIVAMGTSIPEAAVSINAAMRGDGGIAIGNVLGSNVLNILIILGITALIATLAIQKTTIWIEIPFMLVVTLLILGVGYFDGVVAVWDGVILWVFFLIYLGYLFFLARKNKEEKETIQRPTWRLLLAIVLGLAIVVLGSSLAVEGAQEIARIVGISERVIGLTIVAFGTSLPELVTSVTAAKKGNADIAIGNIVGSNIFNILFVIGTAAFITPVTFEKGFLVDGIMAIVAGVMLWLAVFPKKELRRPWGIGMLIVYAAYLFYLFHPIF